MKKKSFQLLKHLHYLSLITLVIFSNTDLLGTSLDDLIEIAKKREVRILSIDGGGIRGLIPLTQLNILEERLQRETGKSVAQTYDAFVGTSTGAIIAIGLANGFDMETAIKLYENNADKIFEKKGLGFLFHKYSNTGLASVLQEAFGNIRLAKLKPVVVTTVFTSKKTGESKLELLENLTKNEEDLFSHDNLAWQSAFRSSLGPIYLSPDKVDDGEYSDGGTHANNPTLKGFRLISDLIKNKVPDAHFLVSSFGTGKTDRTKVVRNTTSSIALKKGLIKVMDGWEHAAQDVHEEMRSISKELNVKYSRFQPLLDEEILLDDINPKTIRKLKHVAECDLCKISKGDNHNQLMNLFDQLTSHSLVKKLRDNFNPWDRTWGESVRQKDFKYNVNNASVEAAFEIGNFQWSQVFKAMDQAQASDFCSKKVGVRNSRLPTANELWNLSFHLGDHLFVDLKDKKFWTSDTLYNKVSPGQFVKSGEGLIFNGHKRSILSSSIENKHFVICVRHIESGDVKWDLETEDYEDSL